MSLNVLDRAREIGVLRQRQLIPGVWQLTVV